MLYTHLQGDSHFDVKEGNNIGSIEMGSNHMFFIAAYHFDGTSVDTLSF